MVQAAEPTALSPHESLPSSWQPTASLAGLAVNWGKTDTDSSRLANTSTPFRNAKQPGQPQATGNTRLCQSPKSSAAALLGDTKSPASRSSAPLLEVLTTYYGRKPERLTQDLTKQPKLKEFLSLDGSTLRFSQDQLTHAQYKRLISKLASAGHNFGSRLPGQLKEAWHSTKKGSEAQQLARHSASLPQENTYQHDRHQPVEASATPAHIRTPSNDAQESLDAGNPFAGDDGELYPEYLDPFAGADSVPDTTATPSEELKNPIADADDALNPFNSPDEPPVSSQPETISAAEQLEMSAGTPAVFLQLLNKYLKTADGRSFGEINRAHAKKLERDIAENTVIGQHLILSGKPGEQKLEWRVGFVSKENLQSLLDAFNTRHGKNSTFYRVLSNFSLVGLGYRMLDESGHQKIIQNASRPALHRPGKDRVVEMKNTAMVAALKHFSSPLQHDRALPNGVLDELIEHYGRVEADRNQLQKTLEKMQNELTLNDTGIVEAIKRFFHQISTEGRLNRFSKEVETADTQLREKMLSTLVQVTERHPPGPVATRTKETLELHLKKAHENYASEMPGTNIYPTHLNAASVEQIENQARQNSHAVLQEIVAGHEKKFVDNLRQAVSSFLAPDYFKGKSREKAVANIIDINGTLASLYETAQNHHAQNISQIAGKFIDAHMQEKLPNRFADLQQGLAAEIRTKVLNNYQEVLNLYIKDLNLISQARPEKFSEALSNIRALAKLSSELTADIAKIRDVHHLDELKLEKKDLDQAVQKSTKPLLNMFRERLPDVQSIGQTLKSAFIRAFKPTPARILGSIPLVGGLAFSLSALPTAIAVPLGITTAVVLPLALIGWVGWNIYKRFDQRSEIEHLHTQISKQLNLMEPAGG